LYAIIGEDPSDVSTLKVLIKRIANDESLSIKAKGYAGCAEMLRKGAKQIAIFANDYDCQRFVVCYDCDNGDPNERHKEVTIKIVEKCAAKGIYCILIPIQELEAWILADIAAVSHVFKGWNPDEITNPEAIKDPKEHLEKLSRTSNRRPRFSHATHNEVVARHLDLQKVANKCPSFRPLNDLVLKGVSNL